MPIQGICTPHILNTWDYLETVADIPVLDDVIPSKIPDQILSVCSFLKFQKQGRATERVPGGGVRIRYFVQSLQLTGVTRSSHELTNDNNCQGKAFQGTHATVNQDLLTT